MYDTVAQYGQVVSGEVEDWHPPAMVRMWQLLHGIEPGTAPMFALQVLLYGSGFALIAADLARIGRRYASAASVLLAISPLVLGWQMVVLKDAQMLGALIAAFAIVAHYRFRCTPLPLFAALLIFLLIVYATLVRANALFATVPLLAFLVEKPRSMFARTCLAIAAILLLLVLQPFINNRIFGASPSGVAKSQPLFDLAAIAAAAPGSVPPFTSAERVQLLKRHCVSWFFWDPVGDPDACGPVTDRADALSEKELAADLVRAVAEHPLAYAKHRLKHWNSTERWLVPPGLIGASPPQRGEPNDEGLASPRGPLVTSVQQAAAIEAATPLGWPITWTTVSLALLPWAWRRRTEAQARLALALLVSAFTLEASFLVISIASDLRYHLWSMVAVPIALILLADRWLRAGVGRTAACALVALVIAGGVLTRAALPKAPNSYQAMLHAPLT